MLTVYFGVQSKRLFREKRRFSWEDMQTGSRELARTIRRDFMPEIIYTLSPRGAIIVYLSISEMGDHIPVYVGIQEDIRNNPFSSPPQDHEVVSTSKWNNYIPTSLFKESDKKLLILDDFAMSGDSLTNLVKFFVKKGFSNDNVKTATLVCTNTAIDGRKAPNYYWFPIPDAQFYFPWGKAK